MLTVALQHCGLDPSFAIGGDLTTSGAGAHHGSGDVFVVEADESDGSFLAFSPDVAVVTNVEPDHLDHHGTEQAYVAVFADFVDRIRPGGALDRLRRRPRRRAARRPGARPRASPSAATAHAEPAGRRPARLHARRRGRPRARPGWAARSWRCGSPCPASTWPSTRWARCWPRVELGAHRDCLARGAGRRSTACGGGSSTGAGRTASRCTTTTPTTPPRSPPRCGPPGRSPGAGRVVVAFQPHLYSRTRDVRRRVRRRAGAGRRGGGARRLRRAGGPGAGRHAARWWPTPCRCPPERVHYVPRWAEVPAVLAGLARPGDLVLTMGAGDITVLGSGGAARAGADRPFRGVATLTPPARRPASGRRARGRGDAAVGLGPGGSWAGRPGAWGRRPGPWAGTGRLDPPSPEIAAGRGRRRAGPPPRSRRPAHRRAAVARSAARRRVPAGRSRPATGGGAWPRR